VTTIALDATYAVDPEPSGVAVYSRKLIESLAVLDTTHRFLLCYRLSRFRQRQAFLRPVARQGGPTFSIRYQQEFLTFWLPWEAHLFHSLAQRPPAHRFRKEIVTVFDVFPLTDNDYSTPDFRRKFSALLREAVGRAERVITASRATESQLVAHAGVARERIRVIPLGVDPPRLTLSPEERRRAREGVVGAGCEMLLSVGVLQTRKNTLNMLKALQVLPPQYRLVLPGGNGYGSEAIYDAIRSQHLEARVKLLGYVEPSRLSILYQAASVFVFPSLEEGFGLPILEAMVSGVPVVTSSVSSMPEVGGDAALYVNPHDPYDIAQKVTQAVEDPGLREQQIRKGLARAREFTWRRTAQETCAVYDEVLASRS
jgi:glycosyltransferase involved in cell wall biosynthesis